MCMIQTDSDWLNIFVFVYGNGSLSAHTCQLLFEEIQKRKFLEDFPRCRQPKSVHMNVLKIVLVRNRKKARRTLKQNKKSVQ